MRTYVIADIGATHDGSFENMVKAVDAAKEAGVSMLKFQWTSDPRRMAARRGRATADGYAEVYARYLNWPEVWHAALAYECARNGIDYGCTVFLPEDVAVVAPYVAHAKLASFEAEDPAMWDAWSRSLNADAWLIASLGMGACKEWRSVRFGDRVRWLRCVSAYPAPVEALQLRRLRLNLGNPETVDVLHGLSDHTDPALVWTGAIAVAAGAEIVEAHLRLDGTNPQNPDYPHAMTVWQFRDYVRHIKFAEACLGEDGESNGPHESERPMLRYKVGGDDGEEVAEGEAD